MSEAARLLHRLLAGRLAAGPLERVDGLLAQCRAGASDADFATSVSVMSRFAPSSPLDPEPGELAEAARLVEGWNPERWTQLEAARVALVLSRSDLADGSFTSAFEEAFRYADEGESCALYRCLGLLPGGERFIWRAGEGCRSNMASVFEAVACDTAYGSRFFDEPTWRQLVIKAVFIGAPLWRVWGLDERLSAELAEMALDLIDERRSARRAIPPELWLCLGDHGGERAAAAIERELSEADAVGRQAAVLGLARAGHYERLRALVATEADAAVSRTIERALGGDCGQSAFGSLERREN